MSESLSDAAVRNAKPKPKPYKVYDGEGLFLLITPSGGKYWRLKHFFGPNETVLSLGVFPKVSLAEARERRDQVRKVLAAGKDPGDSKKEARRIHRHKQEGTFEALAREWHHNQRANLSPEHAKKLLKHLKIHVFNRLGTRPIADITAPELLTVMREIEEHGNETAHRMLQVCGQVFSYAVITGRAATNPALSLRGALKPVVKSTHSCMTPSALPDYLQNLKAYDGALQTKLAMVFLLLTFVRAGELRAAEWSEIDFAKAEWQIPAGRMRTREPYIVPLSRQAIAILRRLHPHSKESKYVFPNQQKPPGFISENTIRHGLYRMGYDSRATGHRFRSTARTVLNEHGFPPDVIECQLAHGERKKGRAACNDAQYLPERRKMMQWWADYLDEVAGKKDQQQQQWHFFMDDEQGTHTVPPQQPLPRGVPKRTARSAIEGSLRAWYEVNAIPWVDGHLLDRKSWSTHRRTRHLRGKGLPAADWVWCLADETLQDLVNQTDPGDHRYQELQAYLRSCGVGVTRLSPRFVRLYLISQKKE